MFTTTEKTTKTSGKTPDSITFLTKEFENPENAKKISEIPHLNLLFGREFLDNYFSQISINVAQVTPVSLQSLSIPPITFVPSFPSTIFSYNTLGDNWGFENPQENVKEIRDRYFDRKRLTMQCIPDVFEKSDIDFEILLVAEYRAIPEVESIFIDEYLDEKIINIFLSINKYDDDLMELLISRELRISNFSPDIVATYNYIPDLINNKQDIITEQTKLIYEK